MLQHKRLAHKAAGAAYSSALRADRHEIRRAALRAITHYNQKHGQSFSELQAHLSEELLRRLAQCKWLERRIESIETSLEKEALRAPRVKGVEIALSKRARALMFALELYCESYYLVAWRASQCLAKLPGLNSFSVVGIRDEGAELQLKTV